MSQLKEELAASENTQAKLNLKIEKLQTRIDKLKAVKQVGSLQYPLSYTAAFDVNVEQEQQELVILSNNERVPTNCVVELETKLKNEAKEKQEALAKFDSLKKEVSRLDTLLRKEAADSRARINEFREVEERNGVRDLPRIFQSMTLTRIILRSGQSNNTSCWQKTIPNTKIALITCLFNPSALRVWTFEHIWKRYVRFLALIPE